jgi:hypothetical protein
MWRAGDMRRASALTNHSSGGVLKRPSNDGVLDEACKRTRSNPDMSHSSSMSDTLTCEEFPHGGADPTPTPLRVSFDRAARATPAAAEDEFGSGLTEAPRPMPLLGSLQGYMGSRWIIRGAKSSSTDGCNPPC